jgi:hypothetical protein
MRVSAAIVRGRVFAPIKVCPPARQDGAQRSPAFG